MNKPLYEKVRETVRWLRASWQKLNHLHRFVAFSTGKDSLALSAMLYEAVGDERPVCLYVHHDLEFPGNLRYVSLMQKHGFHLQVLRPHVEYFELMERGMGFITLKEPWCIPLLIGTGLVDWVRAQGAKSCREAVMFRGMSGSEYSHGLHTKVDIYRRLDMPCINPMLAFTRDEILEILRRRYDLPLNPIYKHMDRSYCICCYTSDAKRQSYSRRHYPCICRKYYGQIEKLLFGTGLIEKAYLREEYKTREEKLGRHGFVHWRRLRSQTTTGAVKRHLSSGVIIYTIRNVDWIDTKHLLPLRGKWVREGNEIRFWDVAEKHSDTAIRRMLNCVECGYCMVECFAFRQFDKKLRKLRMEGCVQCGKCLRLEFCMGWKHRFWRRDVRSD